MVLGQVIKKYHISSNKCPRTNRALPRSSTYTPGLSIKQVHPPQITVPLPSPSLFLTVQIQGKPVSIATLLITLSVNNTMELIGALDHQQSENLISAPLD